MIHQLRRLDRREHRPRALVAMLIRSASLLLMFATLFGTPRSFGHSPAAMPPPPPPVRSGPVAGTPRAEVPPPVASPDALADTAAPAATAASPASPGRQHLVKPGQSLETVLERAEPGDEVILWPGRYSGVTLRGIAGRQDAPITVRGLRAEEPPVIDGGAWGLRLMGASHLRFRDLVVARSRIDGIEIGPDMDGTPSHDIVLEHIRIEEIGERPGRHGIALLGVADVMLRDLSIAGWTGSAIEVVGSRDVTIDRVLITGTGRGEMLGIRLRAGTSRTTVRESRLIEPGLGAIALGGRSQDADFPPDHSADADGRRWEVRGPVIEDVTIVGSDIAFTFLGVTQASIMHATVVDPRRSVLRVARPRDDAGFEALDAASMSRCLLLWREGVEPRLVEFGPGSDDSGLWLEENLWWREAGSFPADTDFPGQESFPQLVDVDPAVGEDLRPGSAAARDFGDRTTRLPGPAAGRE